MADLSSNEDAALRYVLGELNDAERREFESRLATDAALRACVGELEAGLVAAAAASPRRRPPVEVWQRIEKAVAKEAKPKFEFPSFIFGWLRNGWAVAAICLLGWLFYALSAHRQLASVTEQSEHLQREIAAVHSAPPATAPKNVKSLPFVLTNRMLISPPSHTQEIRALRGKIAALQTQTAQLSRLLEQQRALLGETNRVKFYQLASTAAAGNSNGGNGGTTLSPGLQRAVLTALARELGWLGEPPAAAQASGNSVATPVTIGGVDFIDLRPNEQNVVSQPTTQPKIENQAAADNNVAQTQNQSPAQSQIETPPAENSNPTIPAYVSGDNLVVALDSTVVPTGSVVTLVASDANQNQTGGSFVLGNNPAVVTIPFSNGSYSLPVIGFTPTSSIGLSLYFTAPDGQSGTFYLSPASSSPSP
jgi:hypothetical protein